MVALGAGHSHFEDEQFADHVAEALAGCFVILLLPHADPMASEAVLRARCASERGDTWGGVEFLPEWVTSSQNAALADAVVYATSMTPTEIAPRRRGDSGRPPLTFFAGVRVGYDAQPSVPAVINSIARRQVRSNASAAITR